MLELLKFLLEKLDFISIADAVRKRGNRRVAAQLHLILVQSYEIIELYEVLVDELQAALASHERTDEHHRFYLSDSRIASLLKRQSSNLEVIDTMIHGLIDELRIIDNKFAEAYRELIPHKFGLLFEAQGLLARGRLSLAETGPDAFPANSQGEYRTLWFSAESPGQDRRQAQHDLYPWNGGERKVIDVSAHDGDAFFQELKRYFRAEDPLARLRRLREITDSYRDVLLRTFSLEDILSDISKVRKHHSWVR